MFLFWVVIAFIFTGWLVSSIAFYRNLKGLHQVGERLLFVGLLTQLFYIAASYIELHAHPFENLASLLLFGSLLLLLLYFILDFFYANFIFEVIFPPMTLFFLLFSILFFNQGIGTEAFLRETPVFGKLILVAHVSMTMLGYILFGVASLTSIFFLYEEYQIKHKSLRLLTSRFPSLGFLDRLNHTIIALGFLLITVGLLVGITMRIAGHQGPPELSLRQGLPLFTWLVYAGFLLDRSIQGLASKSSAIWSISGFVVVISSFVYEINYLLNR
ncbi:MAG: cytochrome c biogenesis protein CcsA [SAR324 cluster bacterium]|nr:cytochrome c biogenesis protein CcsA [SAR324 cluster bacterium]